MTRNQYTLIAAVSLLAVAAFLFLPTTKKDTTAIAPPQTKLKKGEEKEAFDMTAYLQKVNGNFNSDTLSLLQNWANEKNWSVLTNFYHQKGESVAEAFYAAKGAVSKSDYERAGELFQATASISSKAEMTTYLIENAVSNYEKAFVIDSADIKLRMKLASSYIEQSTNPMKGIGMLLDIVSKDPNNADAQLMLGKFAMMSNQFEKAVQRLEKVLSLRPQSNDALFLLAMAHQNNGNKTKAIELLERCKTNEKNPALKKEIEQYISQLKEN